MPEINTFSADLKHPLWSSLYGMKFHSVLEVSQWLNTTSYDATKLDLAAGRLVEKWRLLAGQLEYDNHVKTWCIRVPTGKLDGIKTHKFTSSFSAEPLDVPLSRVNTTSADILSRPALRYFREGSTPTSLDALSKQKAPILSIHISVLANCTCVGISFPHGVFDGTGMGQVIAGLDAELNGKPWECPSYSSENILNQKLGELQSIYSSDEEPAALAHTKYVFQPVNFINAIRFLSNMGWEYLWHRVETKALYLGKSVIDLIIKEAKERQGEERDDRKFVSTGDILVAWLLKASQCNTTPDNIPVSVSSAISMRPILSSTNPALSTYTHNAIMVCTMPPISTISVRTSSVVEIAAIHRSFLNTVRTPSFIQSYSRWMNSPENNGRVVPSRAGIYSMVFSNQVIAGLSRLDFGVERAMFWEWALPIAIDHMCLINMFEGGYILQASLRKAEWVAIEHEVECLRGRVLGG